MRDLRRIVVGGTLSLLVASGCASVPPGQIAQTAGTIIGSAIAPGIGAPIGSLVGMLTGLVLQGHIDRANEKHERTVLNDQLGGPGQVAGGSGSSADPSGVPTRVWVDETLRDGRLAVGHFEVRYLP